MSLFSHLVIFFFVKISKLFLFSFLSLEIALPVNKNGKPQNRKVKKKLFKQFPQQTEQNKTKQLTRPLALVYNVNRMTVMISFDPLHI